MKKVIISIAMVFAIMVSSFSFGTHTAEAVSNIKVYGPYYTSFTGAELLVSPLGSLADKCEIAVKNYGTYIHTQNTYNCRWYQQIETRVTTTIGTIINVTYYPSYSGGRVAPLK